MRTRFGAATVLVGTLLATTGCTPATGPSYADVRAQAEAAVAEIVAALPDGAEFTADGDARSTPCDSEVAPVDGPEGTAFATVHGRASLPRDVEPATAVEDLPASLGDGWALEPVGIEVDLAAVRLSQARTGVSVDVTETSLEGSPGLDILAVSECGRAE